LTVSSYTGIMKLLLVTTALCALIPLASCRSSEPESLHGYVEGEFVYVAAPLPGTVTLQVERGRLVKAGTPLFALENVTERTARDEAARRLLQARATLEDARKGLRPTEISALRARLQQARLALNLAETESERQEQLFRSGVVSAQAYDQARSSRDQNRQEVARLEAELQTAALGARTDQVAAADANVKALEEALARAEWNLSQKSQLAPVDAMVYDTLYRTGEWVAVGKPVVALLPAANIKVRLFVPERKLGTIHLGDPLIVTVDGVEERFSGRVSFISPRAEYTPPVIYSRENREKLVYMIEISFLPEKAARLHPGQPVEVRFGR
jgi:HlyD family secretion protein